MLDVFPRLIKVTILRIWGLTLCQLRQIFIGPSFALKPISIFIMTCIALFGKIFPLELQAKDGIVFIRDAETENAIRVLIRPIFEAAGLNPTVVQVYIVKDDSLNAFVAGGQKIFINTGTLRHAQDGTEVIGVLAHETGHIVGGHLARLQNDLSKAQATSIAALLLGLPLAIATGRGDVAIAASSLGMQVATRDFLSYTRQNEQAADQFALNFMQKAEINPNGMLAFMERVAEASKLYQNSNQDRYAMTHPLTEDRILFLENRVKQSPYKNKKLPPDQEQMFQRVRAKLDGWIDPPELTLQNYGNDQSVNGHYARAIAYMNQSKTDKALSEINWLINANPDDPFFVETRGDIYRQDGQLKLAIQDYQAVVKQIPWAVPIQVNLAQSLLDLHQSKSDDEALIHLQQAKLYETDNDSLWSLLAAVYERKQNIGQMALARAELALGQSQFLQARNHADKAVNLLPSGSADGLRAKDIYNEANNQLLEIDDSAKPNRRR